MPLTNNAIKTVHMLDGVFCVCVWSTTVCLKLPDQKVLWVLGPTSSANDIQEGGKSGFGQVGDLDWPVQQGESTQ